MRKRSGAVSLLIAIIGYSPWYTTLADPAPVLTEARAAGVTTSREKDIKFVGIDALPGEGVTWVKNGELTATFLYATPGAEGLIQAIMHLNGETVEKAVVLPTMKVTAENAEQVLKEKGL